MVENKNFYTILKDTILQTIKDNENFRLGIYEITDIPNKDANGKITKYTANIKHLNTKTQYDNVPIMTIGAGNLKGILTVPSPGDFAFVAFIDKDPVILGTLFDVYTQAQDNIPAIKPGEMIIVAKEAGSYIYFDEDGKITIAGTAINFKAL